VLAHQAISKLEALGLSTTAAALTEQLESAGPWPGLSSEDRLGLLVDREADAATAAGSPGA
jgi:hypothetical protein